MTITETTPTHTPAVPRPAIVRRVSELIGWTPLYELCRTTDGRRLLLKLEQFNPTGTAKIRMARAMVADAERRGTLRPGGRIVESTSGNTGLGLAVIAAERGYRFTAVVDGHACQDKLRAMKAMGADLVSITAGDEEDDLATAAREELAEQLAAADDSAVFTEQHNNPANAVGYHAVADELAAALQALAGPSVGPNGGQIFIDGFTGGIDVLVGAVGTGGSLCGTARALRQFQPGVRVVGVEPVGSIAFGGPAGNYYQSGTGTPEGAEIGALVDFSLIDEGCKVSDRQAFGAARAIARRTGLLIGGSAGGVVYQALHTVEAARPGTTVVAFVNDGGEKYLDTVFNDDWMAARDLLDPVVERQVGDLLDRLCAP